MRVLRKMPLKSVVILLAGLLASLAAGCAGAPAAPSPAPADSNGSTPTMMAMRIVSTATAAAASPAAPTVTPGVTASPAPSRAPSLTPSTTPTLAPDFWMELPVVPEVNERAREIYKKGLALGNNPGAFSKVGDCEATTTWFLGMFDGPGEYYDLGEHSELAGVIDAFAGSWERNSLAVKAGFSATSVMTPLWADPKQCEAGETPLACEYRLHKPAFALIMLGSNNAARPERFEPQLRALLDETIARGIVPVLSTKADNLEGDHSINAAVARLALEYDIPLWNFWAAVQPLPHHGLDTDGAHLTLGKPDFDDPYALQTAWTVRNLTALQVMDALRRGVEPAN